MRRADVVGVMDADFSHPPALVPTACFATFKATGADVVVASRYVPGGSTPNWPLRRRLLSRVACMLARPLSPIRDAASGFFLIRREIARGVRIKAGGFKICLELLVRAWPHRLVELPYQFDDRELGESKMSLEGGRRIPRAVAGSVLAASDGRRPTAAQLSAARLSAESDTIMKSDGAFRRPRGEPSISGRMIDS